MGFFGLKLSRPFSSSSSVAVVAMSILLAPVASAQVASVPSGSPLDPYAAQRSGTSSSSSSSDQGSSSSSSDSSNPYGGNESFGSLDVNDRSNANGVLSLEQLLTARGGSAGAENTVKRPPNPGEFERYVERLLGRKVPLYGNKLVLPALRDFATPATATIPADYVVQPGDTVEIALSGSLDGAVSREVDTNGRIFLTGVGAIKVGGVSNAALRDTVARAIGTKFRGFTVAVNIKELRGIRVYVTGFANNPGAFTVSSLSTLANAVFQAGGPNAGGSWRGVKLYRNGREVSDFDLYELMRGGSRLNDAKLQNEDVLFIPPAGPQVAVIGSVQEEAIYEARPGESVAEMLAAAGGPNTLGDPSRFILYRSGSSDAPGPQEIPIASASRTDVRPGDIVQMLSTGSLAMPTESQKVLVRVEGEVQRPGIYYVTPGTTTGQIIAQAGGLTSMAFPFGAKMTRESERIQQQESFSEAIKQMEIALAATPLNQDPTISGGDRATQLASARSVLERLRQAKPDGRIILDVAPTASTVPSNILLENNDALYVPKRASTIGVFGAVYRPSSFVVEGARKLRVKDYIELAGGTLRTADRGGIFVVRANGSVISKRRGAPNQQVLPGDLVFVPIRTEPNMFWARLNQITSTILSLGLTTAAVAAVVP